MSNPDPEQFIKSLSPEDIKRLSWLLRAIERVDGWCSINRSIGKFLIFGGIAVLILMSQALDAVKNLLGFKH